MLIFNAGVRCWSYWEFTCFKEKTRMLGRICSTYLFSDKKDIQQTMAVFLHKLVNSHGLDRGFKVSFFGLKGRCDCAVCAVCAAQWWAEDAWQSAAQAAANAITGTGNVCLGDVWFLVSLGEPFLKFYFDLQMVRRCWEVVPNCFKLSNPQKYSSQLDALCCYMVLPLLTAGGPLLGVGNGAIPERPMAAGKPSDAGYEPTGSDMIELHVLCLNGDGCALSISGSTLGLQLHQMISEQFPSKKGSRFKLHYQSSPLILHQTLQEQGIAGKAATLSCTFVPTDLFAACQFLQGSSFSGEELAIEGLTRIAGATSSEYLQHLPKSLESLTFHDTFNQRLAGVTLPSGLQNLTFGKLFDQSLTGVSMPRSLQSLKFGWNFDSSLAGISLPKGLQSLTFGYSFNQCLDGVTLPSGLQSLTFGERFNQSLEGVTVPSGLQSLTFGPAFNQSLKAVAMPIGLQSLKFGLKFNRSLSGVSLPSGLQSLTFGHNFSQSLEGVSLPCGLQNLIFGQDFNQSLHRVTLPSGLQSLAFGYMFDQSLKGVTLPTGLQSLTFGHAFNQSLEGVTFPGSLHSLTLGRAFNKSLEGVTLPIGLQSLTLGQAFNQSLHRVTLPIGLQSLTSGAAVFVCCFGVTCEIMWVSLQLLSLKTHSYSYALVFASQIYT